VTFVRDKKIKQWHRPPVNSLNLIRLLYSADACKKKAQACRQIQIVKDYHMSLGFMIKVKRPSYEAATFAEIFASTENF